MVDKLDMYISRDGAIRNGRPCVAGTAIEVDEVVRMIELGFTRQEVLHLFPSLTSSSLEAALVFAFAHRANSPQLFCA